MKKVIRVLLIEDLLIAQTVAKNILTRLNCNVQVVPMANQALLALANSHFDIIFIDIQLPDATGITLVEEIKGILGEEKKIPFIALTACPREEMEFQARAAGCDDFIQKPLTLKTAKEILEKHLNIKTEF